jgi:hypothetical protein
MTTQPEGQTPQFYDVDKSRYSDEPCFVVDRHGRFVKRDDYDTLERENTDLRQKLASVQLQLNAELRHSEQVRKQLATAEARTVERCGITMTDRIGIDEHVATDRCGFDRNASHSEGRYVCMCESTAPTAAPGIDEQIADSDKDVVFFTAIKDKAPNQYLLAVATSATLRDYKRRETAKNQKLALELQSLLSQSMEDKE